MLSIVTVSPLIGMLPLLLEEAEVKPQRYLTITSASTVARPDLFRTDYSALSEERG